MALRCNKSGVLSQSLVSTLWHFDCAQSPQKKLVLFNGLYSGNSTCFTWKGTQTSLRNVVFLKYYILSTEKVHLDCYNNNNNNNNNNSILIY